MENRYYLGLDGGGTKTHCILYDTKNGDLQLYSGGPTNHEVLAGGLQALPQALKQAIDPLFARVGVHPRDIAGAVFGLSGVDTAQQHEIISGIIRDMGFSNFLLANDAYLAVKAVCGSAGIGAVNGTGCNVVGISPRGDTVQVGGHGAFSGDCGGGDFLVANVIRSVYEQHFKNGPETAMSPMVFRFLGIGQANELMQVLPRRLEESPKETTLEICLILYRAAAQHDIVAKRILEICGQEYARSIRSVATKLSMEPPVAVGLVGSHFTKCQDDTAIVALRNALGHGYHVQIISTKPVAGALLWALELGQVQIDTDVLKKRIADLPE